MLLTRRINIILFAFLICFITSCAENTPNVPSDFFYPIEKIYNASYDKAWAAVLHSLSQQDSIKTVDKSSGTFVTEYRTLDKKSLNMFETILFGRTYKHSFTVNLFRISSNKTQIKVFVNLKQEQFGVYNREREVPRFESYIREQLYDKIDAELAK